MAETLVERLRTVIQCSCTLRERDSGHLTECWKPEANEIIEELERQLADL